MKDRKPLLYIITTTTGFVHTNPGKNGTRKALDEKVAYGGF